MFNKRKEDVLSTGLCPFSWIEVSKPAGCLPSLLGAKESIVSEPQPCMGPSCKLWDNKESDCGLISSK